MRQERLDRSHAAQVSRRRATAVETMKHAIEQHHRWVRAQRLELDAAQRTRATRAERDQGRAAVRRPRAVLGPARREISASLVLQPRRDSERTDTLEHCHGPRACVSGACERPDDERTDVTRRMAEVESAFA